VATRLALFLKGINVGGKNLLPMAGLRKLMTDDLGHAGVQTYLQSGNVVVTAPISGIEQAVTDAINSAYGLTVEVFAVRADDLREVVAGNPFPERAGEPKLLHVAFLKKAPAKSWFPDGALEYGEDRIALGKRHLYLSYAVNSRDSPLAKVLRDTKVSFTARNWSTVCRVAELAGEPPH
jgi:uncharacterized protein (DUF1697 family)